MKLKIALIGVTMLILNSLSAQEITTGKFGKGIFNIIGKDSTFSMKFAVRFQLLAFSSWEDSHLNNLATNNLSFLVRRSRFKFDGFVYSPKLKYKLELGFANRDMSGGSNSFTHQSPRVIMDAYVKWNFHKNLSLWVGQGKLPGNRERIISSANLELVDRSILNSEFNIDRDIGFQISNHSTVSDKVIVREIISITQGEGRNITTGNLGGLQYVGSVEVLPFGEFLNHEEYKGADLAREPTPKLAIKGAYEFNNNAVKTRSNQGSYMLMDVGTDTSGFYETNIYTFFLDGMFKYKGYSFMFEYANRGAENPIARNTDGTATGQVVGIGNAINLQSGYVFPSNWAISGRYTDLNMDSITNQDSQDMYTLGLSKYIVGQKLKIQSDLSYVDVHGGPNETLARLQMEIHF